MRLLQQDHTNADRQWSIRWRSPFLLLTLLFLLLGVGTPNSLQAQGSTPGQGNDQGRAAAVASGPVLLTGDVTYTNPFFTTGIAAPLIVLEDQAGFIDRDPGF